MNRICFGLLVSLLVGFAFFSLGYSQTRSNWHIEVVDKGVSNGASQFTSLAVDRFGDLHLVYSNRAGKELRYAFRKKLGNRWDTVTVDSMGGLFNSLAVDSRGWSHIVYNSPRLPGLFYAWWDGQQWKKTLIDPSKTGHQTSIQLDSQGNAQISYYCEEYSDHRMARDLKYAFFDGSNWYIQTVDHRAGTGKWNSIALDRANHPYISYSVTTPGNLSLANLDGSGWERSLADPPNSKHSGIGYLDGASSLAIDASSQPKVAYVDVASQTINYAWREGSTWHQETVDSLLSVGFDSDRISLKLDHEGQPHLIFYDSGLGSLKYATRDEKGWHIETVDADYAGDYASLYLDGSDQPYVSYSAPVDEELRIAYRLPSSAQKQ